MAIQILLLLGGLILILLGANWLVDGASSIAKRFGLSEFVIGLTIVGIGTSTPEMVVSFMSAIQGNADMAVGNIVGSNIFNVLMIIGITALIAPLDITKSNLKRDIPLNILVTVLLILLGLNFTIFGANEGLQIGIKGGMINRIDGAILLALFAWYLWKSFKSDSPQASGEESGIKQYSIIVSILFIAGGLAGLVFGGNVFVNAATAIAKMSGMSDKFIAITIMAAGTSMPELATCVVAALKGRGQLALGNVLGSNIGNVLLILGGAALIRPLSFNAMTYVDLGILLITSLFFVASAYMFKKNQIDRYEGAILILMEAGYMWYLISNL